MNNKYFEKKTALTSTSTEYLNGINRVQDVVAPPRLSLLQTSF